MNQGIAFARTIRALAADDFRSSKLGLAVAFVLLVAWAWWMFAARVPQYESTTDVRVESGRVFAHFSGPANVRAGQPAFVTIGSDKIPARTQNIVGRDAELVFTGRQPTITSSAPTWAEVEISRLSPAAIAFGVLKRIQK